MSKETKNMLVFSISFALAVAILIFCIIFVNGGFDETPKFEMVTVKTGDVTWSCLKNHGAYIGCNTVEEYK